MKFFCFSLLVVFFPVVTTLSIGVQNSNQDPNYLNYWKLTWDSFDPNATLISLVDDDTSYEFAQNGSLDLIMTGSTLYNCLSLEYNYSAIATHDQLMQNFSTFLTGGTIIARKNSNISRIEDLKEKVIGLPVFSYLTACQSQWGEMVSNGVDLFSDTKAVIITGNNENTVNFLYNGTIDVGFIGPGGLEMLSSERLVPDISNFQFVNVKYYNPYPTSTELYPLAVLSVAPQVPIPTRKQVSESLFQIAPDDTAAIEGNYTEWIPPVSYLGVLNLQERIGVVPLTKVDADTKCVRPGNVYDVIQCRPGYHTISDRSQSCALQNFACPDGMVCICRPCRQNRKKQTVAIIISVLASVIVLLAIITLIVWYSRRVQTHINPSLQEVTNQLFLPEYAIKIEKVLGQGSFGTVYLAGWNGIKIALKVTRPFRAGINEAVLGEELVHENIVKTYAYRERIRTMIGSDASTNSRQERELWILQEYCELGSLSRNFWKLEKDGYSYINSLYTLLEIANGLDCLHSKSIIHSDINCNNVLLQNKETRNFDKKNFVAKIADLGMITLFDKSKKSYQSINTCGTITHMAPEMLLHGHQSPACDIYAFGIMMWEIWYQKIVYEDKDTSEIINLIVEKKRPELSAECPFEYRNLMERCWRNERHQRPSIESIITELGSIISKVIQKV